MNPQVTFLVKWVFIGPKLLTKNQTQRQIDFLKGQLKPDGCVLDVACGTGRHLIALAEAGYCMVGLDVSARLLKIAKQRGATNLVRGDMRFLPFKAEAFASAISMDTSFGYLPTEQEDAESLAEVRQGPLCGRRICSRCIQQRKPREEVCWESFGAKIV